MKFKISFLVLLFVILIALGGISAYAQNNPDKPNKERTGKIGDKAKQMGMPLFVKIEKLTKTGFIGKIQVKERMEKIADKAKPERAEKFEKMIETLNSLGSVTFKYDALTNKNIKHDTLSRKQLKVGQTVAVLVSPEDLKAIVKKDTKVLTLKAVATPEVFASAMKEMVKDRMGNKGDRDKKGMPLPVKILSINGSQITVKAMPRSEMRKNKDMPEPKDRDEDNQKQIRKEEMEKKIAGLGQFTIKLPAADQIFMDSKPNGSLTVNEIVIAMIDPKEFKKIIDGNSKSISAKAILDVKSLKALGKKMKEGHDNSNNLDKRRSKK